MKDKFGKAILELYTKGKTNIKCVTYREDGVHETTDLKKYLQPYKNFVEIQKKALKHVKGHILDIGCGGGKHSLYLQEKGLQVTAIDNSPSLIKLCKKRGIKDVRNMDLFHLDFKGEKFDTILLLGNGLSFGHNPIKMKKFLNKLYKITSKEGIIIGDSTNTKKASRKLLHWEKKTPFKFGSMVKGKFVPRFTPFFVSDSQLRSIVKNTKWKIKRVYKDDSNGRYSVVLEKR